MKSLRVVQIAAALLALTFSLRSPSLAQEHKHEPQQDATSLKLSTDLVSLSVTVTDKKGRAITGLKRENFKVYENGVEQPLSFFSAEEAPVSWGIVLDRSGSMMEMIRDVYRAAVHVVDEGTDEDETFIVTFNKNVELGADFISDKHRLQNSILGLRADGGTALWDAVDFALDHLKKARHRKKVLVVITDGEDNSSRIKFRELIERAEEANVLIYPVGMFESIGRFSPGMSGGDPRGELEKLAEVTGARAHFPTDVEQCQATMKEIASEVSHQYSLGYYPTDQSDPARNGKWRKIRIVAGRSETGTAYVARARDGYYAPRGEEDR